MTLVKEVYDKAVDSPSTGSSLSQGDGNKVNILPAKTSGGKKGFKCII